MNRSSRGCPSDHEVHEKLLDFADIKEVPFKPLHTHQRGYGGKTEERNSQTLVRAG